MSAFHALGYRKVLRPTPYTRLSPPEPFMPGPRPTMAAPFPVNSSGSDPEVRIVYGNPLRNCPIPDIIQPLPKRPASPRSLHGVSKMTMAAAEWRTSRLLVPYSALKFAGSSTSLPATSVVLFGFQSIACA